MANYATTDYSSGNKDTFALAVADLVTKINTIDDAKTLHYVDVLATGRDRENCEGVLIYDT
jgi:hypothetical protein